MADKTEIDASKVTDENGNVVGAQTAPGEYDLIKALSNIPSITTFFRQGKVVEIQKDNKGNVTTTSH